MENKIKDIKKIMTAFMSRNEALKEEIKNNEEVIEEMEKELTLLNEEQLKKM